MDMIMGEVKTSVQEMKMNEKYAQKDYVELMEDSKESRATDLKSLTEAESSKADLEGTLTESKMEEKYAQKDYVELMEDSKESRATDLKSLTEAESSKADLEGTLTEAKENQMLTLEQSQ